MAEAWEEIDYESEQVSERFKYLGSHLYPRRIWDGLALCTCCGVFSAMFDQVTNDVEFKHRWSKFRHNSHTFNNYGGNDGHGDS
jgi:hypothetical protein